MTLKEYLAHHLPENATPDEVERLKRRYRKIYLKNYKAQYKGKRKELVFSPEEFKRLEKLAGQHQMKLGSFIKACTFAYIDQEYILPDDQQALALERQIRAIGNNINQITYKLNATGQYNTIDSETIYHNLYQLEQAVSTAFRAPPNLLDYLKAVIKENPNLKHQIQNLFYYDL